MKCRVTLTKLFILTVEMMRNTPPFLTAYLDDRISLQYLVCNNKKEFSVKHCLWHIKHFLLFIPLVPLSLSLIKSVLVFCCCVINYHKLSSLIRNAHLLAHSSVAQISTHSSSGFSNQRLILCSHHQCVLGQTAFLLEALEKNRLTRLLRVLIFTTFILLFISL